MKFDIHFLSDWFAIKWTATSYLFSLSLVHVAYLGIIDHAKA